MPRDRIDPPWWWKPWINPAAAIREWWERPRPVRPGRRSPWRSLGEGFGWITLDPSPRLRRLREEMAARGEAVNVLTGERTPFGQPLPPLPDGAYSPDAVPLDPRS